MGYFDGVFISFLDKDSIPCTFPMEGQKALGLNLKYLKLCSEDERHEKESLITYFSFLGELFL